MANHHKVTRLSKPFCGIQEADPSRLELAVRSAVVLARMKAHQKAQLVRLLAKGLQVTDDRYLKVRFSPLTSRITLSKMPESHFIAADNSALNTFD